MIKILRLTNRLNVGGPTFNVALLSKYIGIEFETKILAGNIEPHESSSSYILENLGLSYINVPQMFRRINPVADFKALIFIIKYINKYKPDIIHTHAAKAGALGRIGAFFAKHKTKIIIHTYHGNVFDGYFSLFKSKIILVVERFLARHTTKIIALSEKQKRELFEKYRICDSEKIEVVPLGFDLNSFSENLEFKRTAFRSSFKIDDNTCVISIIGRLTSIKNHNFLIEKLASIKGKTGKKVLLLIVGDGEDKASIMEFAQRMNLNVGNVKSNQDARDLDILFLSWRKDIDHINAASDIVALCSLNEGTPVSIIEAMSSSRAVITTNVGGISDFVDNNQNGVVVDFDNYEEQLLRLIKDEDYRNFLASNASSVYNQFHYTNLIENTRTLYFNCLKSK
jgi:glycosyltransferase involved in cell wall biosynthesis